MNGMEMMVKSLIKMMGLDPVKMTATVDEIRKSLSNAAADMATIRRQNQAIMAHLGIADIAQPESDNGGQLIEQRTDAGGTTAGTDPGR